MPRTDRNYALSVGLRMFTLRRLVLKRDGMFMADPQELPPLGELRQFDRAHRCRHAGAGCAGGTLSPDRIAA